MSTLEALIAEVLSMHRPKRPWSDSGRMKCGCGGVFIAEFESHLYLLHREHVATMLAPVIREELRGAFGWMSEAVTEAAQKAPAPSATPDLANAYWNGYRAASSEVSDLLVEPKLIETAINHRSNDE